MSPTPTYRLRANGLLLTVDCARRLSLEDAQVMVDRWKVCWPLDRVEIVPDVAHMPSPEEWGTFALECEQKLPG